MPAVLYTVLLTVLPLYNLVVNFNAMNISTDYAARDYAQTIFKNSSDGATIIADGDEHYFALMYYRYVIASEKNQTVVSAELLQFDWYFDNIRRVVPGVNASAQNLSDRIAAVIEANLTQGREVYTTVPDDSFASYALEPRDGFYRVTRKLR